MRLKNTPPTLRIDIILFLVMEAGICNGLSLNGIKGVTCYEEQQEISQKKMTSKWHKHEQ
jgi:hypothetical protein